MSLNEICLKRNIDLTQTTRDESIIIMEKYNWPFIRYQIDIDICWEIIVAEIFVKKIIVMFYTFFILFFVSDYCKLVPITDICAVNFQ